MSGAASLIGVVVLVIASQSSPVVVEAFAERLPDGCLVAMVSRDGIGRVPNSEFRLASGDHLTLVCETNAAMRDARRLCQGE